MKVGEASTRRVKGLDRVQKVKGGLTRVKSERRASPESGEVV